MATLVYHLDWNYVATLGEEGNLGGIDAFIAYSKARSNYLKFLKFIKNHSFAK